MSLTERSAYWRFANSWAQAPGWFTQDSMGVKFQVPVIMTLPELLSNGMTMLKGDSTFLLVDLSQSATKEQEPKTLSLGGRFKPYSGHKPYEGLFPQTRPNQYDHGGQQTPIQGSSGYFWSSIQKFHPKKTRIPGLGHTTTS